MMPAALVVAAEEEYSVLIPAWYDIIWSAVCLAIIAGVLLWKVVPALTKILDERSEKIEGGLAAGETARAEAEALRAEVGREMAEARVAAARVREQATEDGNAIIAEARAKAQAEAERVVANAQRQLEAERQQAEISLKADVGMLATTLASRIVGESLADDARRSRVIDRFLDELDEQVSAQRPAGERVAGAGQA
ncbi:F0F1 ATP synthase subunit B [Georgenia wangjunii]|uniref:F0F1 ATP synthase subunit B n=1 Tax=Georgenia wangjunii TaxID=3117730 RepID=UPI002F25F069